MSKCNIVIKDDRNPKRELVLYKHTDGHPSIVVDSLSKMLYEIYSEYEKYGDTDWFLEPTNIASKIIIKSINRIPQEVLDILSKLDDTTRRKFQMYSEIDIPSIVPEIHRVANCNYEYIITLKEIIDSIIFRGYNLEVIKLNNGKKVQDVLSIDINLNAADKVKVGGTYEEVEI